MPSVLEQLIAEVHADGLCVQVVDMQVTIADLRRRGVPLRPDANATAAGLYLDLDRITGVDSSGLEPQTAYISNSLDKMMQSGRLLHEWGHHKCNRSGCPCMHPDYFGALAEPHAHRFALTRMSSRRKLRHRFSVCCAAEAAEYIHKAEYRDATLCGALIVLLLRHDAGVAGAAELKSCVGEVETAAYAAYEGLVLTGPLDSVRAHALSHCEICPDLRRRSSVEQFVAAPLIT